MVTKYRGKDIVCTMFNGVECTIPIYKVGLRYWIETKENNYYEENGNRVIPCIGPSKPSGKGLIISDPTVEINHCVVCSPMSIPKNVYMANDDFLTRTSTGSNFTLELNIGKCWIGSQLKIGNQCTFTIMGDEIKLFVQNGVTPLAIFSGLYAILGVDYILSTQVCIQYNNVTSDMTVFVNGKKLGTTVTLPAKFKEYISSLVMSSTANDRRFIFEAQNLQSFMYYDSILSQAAMDKNRAIARERYADYPMDSLVLDLRGDSRFASCDDIDEYQSGKWIWEDYTIYKNHAKCMDTVSTTLGISQDKLNKCIKFNGVQKDNTKGFLIDNRRLIYDEFTIQTYIDRIDAYDMIFSTNMGYGANKYGISAFNMMGKEVKAYIGTADDDTGLVKAVHSSLLVQLTVTYAEETLKLYYDGILVATNALGRSYKYDEFNNFTIGGCNTAYGYDRYRGTMYSFRIWKRALYDIEIASCYNTDKAKYISGAVRTSNLLLDVDGRVPIDNSPFSVSNRLKTIAYRGRSTNPLAYLPTKGNYNWLRERNEYIVDNTNSGIIYLDKEISSIDGFSILTYHKFVNYDPLKANLILSQRDELGMSIFSYMNQLVMYINNEMIFGIDLDKYTNKLYYTHYGFIFKDNKCTVYVNGLIVDIFTLTKEIKINEFVSVPIAQSANINYSMRLRKLNIYESPLSSTEIFQHKQMCIVSLDTSYIDQSLIAHWDGYDSKEVVNEEYYWVDRKNNYRIQLIGFTDPINNWNNFNKEYMIDNTNAVLILKDILANSFDSITFSLRVKINELSNIEDNYLISKESGVEAFMLYLKLNTNGKLSSKFGINEMEVDITNLYDYHTIDWTIDIVENKQKLYVDGILVKSLNSPSNPSLDNDVPITILSNTIVGKGCNGAIQRFCIYDRPLRTADVQYNYLIDLERFTGTKEEFDRFNTNRYIADIWDLSDSVGIEEIIISNNMTLETIYIPEQCNLKRINISNCPRLKSIIKKSDFYLGYISLYGHKLDEFEIHSCISIEEIRYLELSNVNVPVSLLSGCSGITKVNDLFNIEYKTLIETVGSNFMVGCPVITIESLFENSKLKSVGINFMKDNKALINCRSAFANCLIENIEGLFETNTNLTHVDKCFMGDIGIISKPVPFWDWQLTTHTKISSYAQCYTGCDNISGILDIPPAYK